MSKIRIMSIQKRMLGPVNLAYSLRVCFVIVLVLMIVLDSLRARARARVKIT